MTPTEAFIQERRAAGDTATQVAAAIAADVATARNILTDELAGFLTRVTLFPAFLAYKSGQLAVELEVFRGAFATLDYILLNLRGRPDGQGGLEGGYIHSTDPAIAGQMAAMIAGFKSAGLMTDAEEDGFIALGGGYRYDRLTVDQVEVTWSTLDSAAALSTLRQDLAIAYNAVVAAIDEGERDRAMLAALFSSELEA